jgi:hypothetical protein
MESNRKQNAVQSALRAHDRVAKVENQRRLQQLNTNAPLFGGKHGSGGYNSFNLLTNLSFGSGCRCCYDPNGDGGEYELLASMKREREMNSTAAVGVGGGAVDDEETGSIDNAGSGNDSDSDDEFNYLLECDIPTTDNYGDDRIHGDYDDLQSQRRADLQNMAYHNEVARYHGYGVHRQMHPKRIFAAAGYVSDNNDRDKMCPPGSVVHLFDAYSSLSVSLDICLENMAMRYRGTKFVRGIGITSKLYAEGGDSDWKRGDLPMLLAIKSGRIVAWSSGLRDFYRYRNQTQVEDALVEQWLDRAGVLHTYPPPLDALCKIRPQEDVLLENTRSLNELGRGGLLHRNNLEEVDVEEERFDCGLVGCNKSFYHEHVGVKNDAQAGVLVKESQVVTSSNNIVA